MDEADRLLRRAAVWACDSRYRQGDLRARMVQSAERHGLRDLRRHRAMGGDEIAGDAKHLLLGLVAVSDEAALEHLRGAGDFGQGGGDQPAGAGFGERDFQLARPAGVEHASRQSDHFILHLASQPIHGSRTVAMARAAMPSWRPVKPRRSVVVAFTATRSSGSCAISAIFRADGVAVRPDLGTFADQGGVDMGEFSAARGHALDCVAQKAVGGGAAPLRVARREMGADIAVRNRAEHGVGDGVEQHVGVGMADQPAVVRHFDPAEPDMVARRRRRGRQSPGRCGYRADVRAIWPPREKNPQAW